MNPQLLRQNHKGISCRPENRFGVIARRRDFLLAPFERVNVRQHEHHAINLIIQSQIGADAQGIPAAFLVLHLQFTLADGVDDFLQQLFEVGQIEIVPDVAQGTAHDTGKQVEQFSGQRGETADGQVAREQQDGHVDAGVKIVQVRTGAV